MLLSSAGDLQIDGAFTLNGSTSGRVKIQAPAEPTGFIATGSTITSGTTLTIGTITSGSVAIGQEITGTGVTAGTKITANISGSGNGSTWTVSPSQSVSSTTITGYSSYTLPVILPTTTGLVLTSSVSGTLSWAPLTSVLGGDVVGPSSATSNAVPRFNGVSGKIIKNSPVIINDFFNNTGDVYGVGRLTVSENNVYIVPNTSSSTSDQSGGVTMNSFPEGSQSVTSTVYATSDNNPNVNFTVDTFNAGNWGGAKYTFLCTRRNDSSGVINTEIADVLVTHNGSSVAITQLGQAATADLVTYGASLTTISGILTVTVFADPVGTGNTEDYYVTGYRTLLFRGYP
jgi:hypothetical protein